MKSASILIFSPGLNSSLKLERADHLLTRALAYRSVRPIEITLISTSRYHIEYTYNFTGQYEYSLSIVCK